jgi:folate-binding protein YgfZ
MTTIRHCVQIFDRFSVTGRDAASFLQGMLTNDIVGLAVGSGCYAFQLDPSGHVLADLTVIRTPDAVEILVESGVGMDVSERLAQYLIMERCRISPVAVGCPVATLWGEGAVSAVESLAGSGWNASQEADHASVAEFAPSNRVVRLPIALGAAFRWWLDSSDLDGALGRLSDLGSCQVSDAEFIDWRIACGIPVFGVDFSTSTLAMETGQNDRAIHFRKGCYIGQEIVARIDARGRVRRTMARLELAGVGEEDAVLLREGKEVGRVTSRTRLLPGKPQLALGMLRCENAEAGSILECGSGFATVLVDDAGAET